ncbi:site-specific integrase [uncultured Shimia sp.]|uniref:tyrosine-type recombinase/integrase n=1 Tax=uncultured Shimia sp. TaxID=573152 RepID=UPI002613C875|nr:site-specific integrase [uncultured Shimia sp.]
MESIIPLIGHIPLIRVDGQDIQFALNKLLTKGNPVGNGKPLSLRTVQSTKAVLAVAMKHAVVLRLIPVSPMDGVTLPTARKNKPLALTVAQVAQYIELMDRTSRFGNALRFLFLSGCRRSELGGLMWEDVHDTHVDVRRTLYKRRDKNGKFELALGDTKTASSARTIPLSQALRDVLAAQRKQNAEERLAAGPIYKDKGMVFPGERGGFLELGKLSQRAHRAKKKLGFPDNVQGIHTARHSFATMLHNQGVDPKTLQSLLGHANISTTLQLYCSADEEHRANAVDLIGNALGGIG